MARAEQAQQELRERRWAEAAEYRARLNKDKPKLTDVQPSSDAEVVGMAVRFLQKMAELEPDPNKRSWYRLFRHMDDDGSGRINFHELVDMVRTELYLKPKEMPEATLKSLWAALDKDGSGYVAAGEFGTFMRKGEAELRMLHPPTTWKKRLESARRQEAAAVTSALNKEKNAMVGVVAASEKDVDNLSLQLNQKLLKLFPKNPAWYKLFRHSTRRARILDLEGLRVMNARNLPCSVDDDGSGKITYAELLDMVRSELEISSSEMPDSMLKRVWVALDKDGSGYMVAGEFGAFMRKGEATLRAQFPQTTWKERRTARNRLEAAAVTAALNKEKNAMLGVQVRGGASLASKRHATPDMLLCCERGSLRESTRCWTWR